MDRVSAASAADGGQRLGRARTWLTKLARPALAYSPTLAAVPDYLYRSTIESTTSDSEDDATVYTSALDVRRERSFSHASNGSCGDTGATIASTTYRRTHCETETSAFQHGASVLDSARVDTAIAAILRARQQDQLGNHGAAAQLFVVGLERLSLALRDADGVEDTYVRERLAMLKLLVETGDGTVARGLNSSTPACISKAEATSYSSLAPLPSTTSLMAGAPSGLTGALMVAAAGVLSLLTQAAVMWLVFLGNIVVWTTVQLKNSQLPEVAANHMIKLGGWMHSSCSEHGVYEKALRAGRVSVTWLSAVDREAAFSQRLLCSAAAILGTVARIVENAAAAGQS